jgi:integrase
MLRDTPRHSLASGARECAPALPTGGLTALAPVQCRLRARRTICQANRGETLDWLEQIITGQGHALQEYLAVRGAHSPQNGSGCFAKGSGDHVFLYRNAPLKKGLIRAQLKYAGERVGVKVYPHRLRHTCATQLLNAGCRVTSIQRFLGHKKLNSTMIYARAHDQTVAEDYFTAMQRVEERLDIMRTQAESRR